MSIDYTDWHIAFMDATDDCYYKFEVKTDYDWYTLTGTYNGREITIDSIISGHSGYGHEITITEKIERYFNIYLCDTLVKQLELWIEKGYYRSFEEQLAEYEEAV